MEEEGTSQAKGGWSPKNSKRQGTESSSQALRRKAALQMPLFYPTETHIGFLTQNSEKINECCFKPPTKFVLICDSGNEKYFWDVKDTTSELTALSAVITGEKIFTFFFVCLSLKEKKLTPRGNGCYVHLMICE